MGFPETLFDVLFPELAQNAELRRLAESNARLTVDNMRNRGLEQRVEFLEEQLAQTRVVMKTLFQLLEQHGNFPKEELTRALEEIRLQMEKSIERKHPKKPLAPKPKAPIAPAADRKIESPPAVKKTRTQSENGAPLDLDQSAKPLSPKPKAPKLPEQKLPEPNLPDAKWRPTD